MFVLHHSGVSIIRSEFRVGRQSMATCTSDTPATLMEWLTNGVVVESAMSTQSLDLTTQQVNDSIHNDVFICRVTREDGSIATQNFTVNIVGKWRVNNTLEAAARKANFISPLLVPAGSVMAVVSRSGTARAGMVYNLTCTVSKAVDGLTNPPTATWMSGTGLMPVSNGNGITPSTSSDGVSTMSTLTFVPLRTSHNGAYMCVGSLNSPARHTPLMPSVEEELLVQSNAILMNTIL